MNWQDTLASLLSDEDKAQLAAEKEATPTVEITKKLPALRLMLDKRKGKTATLLLGMEQETEEDVLTLAKTLKNKLAVGGSARDGEILLQGDVREKCKQVLQALGYKVKC